MSKFDPSLFSDIADFLGLSSPAFIEKDYYAVQLLKVISEIKLSTGVLIFSGGTCLSKAHFTTFRMSEDLDFKFIPGDDFYALSDRQKRNYRSDFGQLVAESIKNTTLFTLTDKGSKNEGRYRCFSVNYPKTYMHTALRSELKVEFTEIITSHLLPTVVPISSLYASITEQPYEISNLLCDRIEIILIEKFLGLLRRTAEVCREHSHLEDPALVRHVYDMYLINFKNYNHLELIGIFKKILQQDVIQFGMRHFEFQNDPISELLYGLDHLKTNIKYKNQYTAFLVLRQISFSECLAVAA